MRNDLVTQKKRGMIWMVKEQLRIQNHEVKRKKTKGEISGTNLQKKNKI